MKDDDFNIKDLTFNGLLEKLKLEDALFLNLLAQDNPVLYEILETGLTVLRTEARLIKPDMENSIQKTYFIKSKTSGLIKIGKSINPELRVKTIANTSGMVLELLHVINRNIENDLHKRFKKYRIQGEWFHDIDGLIEKYIEHDRT